MTGKRLEKGGESPFIRGLWPPRMRLSPFPPFAKTAVWTHQDVAESCPSKSCASPRGKVTPNKHWVSIILPTMILPLRACLGIRPVRGPGQQPRAISTVSRRPHAPTRRFGEILEQALSENRRSSPSTRPGRGTAAQGSSVVAAVPSCHSGIRRFRFMVLPSI